MQPTESIEEEWLKEEWQRIRGELYDTDIFVCSIATFHVIYPTFTKQVMLSPTVGLGALTHKLIAEFVDGFHDEIKRKKEHYLPSAQAFIFDEDFLPEIVTEGDKQHMRLAVTSNYPLCHNKWEDADGYRAEDNDESR